MNYDDLYRILDNKYPLKNKDCGKLCNKACCSNDHEETGMYLFPGEEKRYSGSDWYKIVELTTEKANVFPYDRTPIYKFICNGTCPREERPLACRIFPTFPKLHDNGVFNMVFDLQAYMLCPIAKKYKFKEMDNDFIKSCRQVWRILLEDELLYKRYLELAHTYEETIKSPWFKLMTL